MRLAPCFLLFLTLGCGIETSQTERIASELCECIKPLQNSMSNTTIDLLFKASFSDSPRQVLIQSLNKLNKEEKKKVGEELGRYSELVNSASAPGLCIRNVQKQSRVVFVLDQKKFVEDLIDLLEKKNCTIAAAILRSNLKTSGYKAMN